MVGAVPALVFIGLAIFALGYYLGGRRGVSTERLAMLIRSEGRAQANRVIAVVRGGDGGGRATLYGRDTDAP